MEFEVGTPSERVIQLQHRHAFDVVCVAHWPHVNRLQAPIDATISAILALPSLLSPAMCMETGLPVDSGSTIGTGNDPEYAHQQEKNPAVLVPALERGDAAQQEYPPGAFT